MHGKDTGESDELPGLPSDIEEEVCRLIDDPKGLSEEKLEALCKKNPDLGIAIRALACTLAASADKSGGMPEDDPRQVGPFRILQKLGEGGMGIVYLAEQTEPVQRRVALKIIKPGMDSRQVLARFKTERQALAMMNHDNIARVFDAGETDSGQPYFVMEHAPGISLTSYCDRQKLTTRERLVIFQKVCAGVQHAHQKGVIHRDLKPSNILVTEHQGQAVPKIIDFGVAKTTGPGMARATLVTAQGMLIGTPEYMSPEQAEMDSADIDTRSDIYSLGVILYELLVGDLPFSAPALRAAGVLEAQRMIREEETPKPSTKLSMSKENARAAAHHRRTTPAALRRAVRGDLDWIAMRAMDKDRNRRYASASELAADIGHHLDGEPVTAGPPSAFYLLKKLTRKHWGKASAVVLVIMSNAYDREMLVSKELLGKTEKLRGKIKDLRVVGASLRDALIAEKGRAGKVDIEEFLARLVSNLDATPPTIPNTKEYVSSRIEVRKIIASLYAGLGKTREAMEQMETARRKCLEEFDEDSLELAEVLADLAMYAAKFPKKLDLAIGMCRKAYEIRERELSPTHIDTYSTLGDLSILLKKSAAHELEGKALGMRALARLLQKPDDWVPFAGDPEFVGLADLWEERAERVGAKAEVRARLERLFKPYLDDAQYHRKIPRLLTDVGQSFEKIPFPAFSRLAEPLLFHAREFGEELLGSTHPLTLDAGDALDGFHTRQAERAKKGK